jgi:hypothetical protein
LYLAGTHTVPIGNALIKHNISPAQYFTSALKNEMPTCKMFANEQAFHFSKHLSLFFFSFCLQYQKKKINKNFWT